MALTGLADLGFAEFIASLLSETFESIVATQAQQHQRQVELREAVALPLEAFTATHVTDEEVTLGLAFLAPADEDGHAVVGGAPVPPTLDEQFPDLLEAGDTTGSGSDRTLTDRGVERIVTAVALRVGAARQRAIADALRAGVPRVAVEGGDITARLAFRLLFDDLEDDADDEGGGGDDGGGGPGEADGNGAEDAGGTAVGRAVPSPLLARPRLGAGLSDVPALRGDLGLDDALRRRLLTPDVITRAVSRVRVAVRPAGTPAGAGDGGATEEVEDHGDVFGEVRLRFRTID